ncbi:hypothetical protein C359_04054 [Cryptococcus neoformans Bt120]|nr:hypothetical protein C359_04054 [Cryptococcus neoformans var. grubii Bt120]
MGNNALYVLRLLWRAPPAARGVSSVALPPCASPPATCISTPPATSPAPPFLEDESAEYATAALTLPELRCAPSPIPWPTLLPRPPAAAAPPRRPKFCDPLFRLVLRAQHSAALAIHAELRAHAVYIQPRHEYLAPATAALAARDTDQFFLWLALYPNKPATANTPELRAIWHPLLALVVAMLKQPSSGSGSDHRPFLARFLAATAKLGVLPTVLPALTPHLAFTLPPAASYPLLSDSIAAYTKYTTSAESTSKRAQVQRGMVRRQVAGMWAAYLRGLIAAGWREEAKRLFEAPPDGVEWDPFTSGYVVSRLAPCLSAPGPPFPLSTPLKTTSLPLSKQLLSTSLSPTHLASVLHTLSSQPLCTTHPNLLPRFKQRFLRRTFTTGTRERERTWLHAEIINLQKQGRHHDAVQTFADHFFWVGLPPHPSFSSLSATSKDASAKHYPSIQILVTLLPSLLPLLPAPLSSSVPNYLDAYVQLATGTDPALAPALRPNSVMWSVVVREIVHWGGGGEKGLEQGRKVLALARRASEASEASDGPGEAAYRALLLALAGRRRVDEMYDLLDHMESLSSSSSSFPAEPSGTSPKTYIPLVAILAKTGLAADAQRVLQRGVDRFGGGWVGNVVLD